MSPWCLPCPLSFSGWWAGARILRPVICFGRLWLSLCVRCFLVCVLPLLCLRGVAGFCWLLVVAVVSSSVALFVFAFGVWGCFGLARFLLASSSCMRPFSLACAASSLLSLLPSRAPSLSCFAGLRLLSSPSSLFVLWLSLPASLPLCVLVCCLLPPFLGFVFWPPVVFVGFVLVCCSWSALPVLMFVWWAVPDASLLR